MNNVEVIHLKTLDEERLRFRVILGLNGSQYAAALKEGGEYEFNMPPITNYNNNRKYDNCLITMDGFVATPGAATALPVWNVNSPVIPPPGNVIAKLGALCIELDVPSSQSLLVSVPLAATVHSGGTLTIGGGFKQFINIRKVEVGDITGAAGPGAAMYAWEWPGHQQEPILCANPFGTRVKLTISTPAVDASTCWLMQGGGAAGGADVGEYSCQFTIEMVASGGGSVN